MKNSFKWLMLMLMLVTFTVSCMPALSFAGSNVKNYFSQPNAAGDNVFTIGGTQNVTGTLNITSGVATFTTAAIFNGGINFGNTARNINDANYEIDISTDVDMNAAPIKNIGNAGTDFNALGGLTLAADLTITGNDIVFGNGETISNATDASIKFTDGTNTLATIVDIGSAGAFNLGNTNRKITDASYELQVSTDINMTNAPIKNIGNAGTDFTGAGGLILADDLTVSGNDITFGNGETISNSNDGLIRFTDGVYTLLNIKDEGSAGSIYFGSASRNIQDSGYAIAISTDTNLLGNITLENGLVLDNATAANFILKDAAGNALLTIVDAGTTGNGTFSGTVTATSYGIGGNTLDTNEFGYLDGTDQALKKASAVTHQAGIFSTSIYSASQTLTSSYFNPPIVFLAPKIANTTVIMSTATHTSTLVGLVANGTSYTLAKSDYADMVTPRNIQIVFCSTAPLVTAQMHSTATVVVAGKNTRGEAISETITAHENSSTSIPGLNAFSTITSFTITGATVTFNAGYAATSVGFNIGPGTKIGLPADLDSSTEVLKVIENGALSTAYTLNTTYDTIVFASAPDGSKNYTAYLKPPKR